MVGLDCGGRRSGEECFLLKESQQDLFMDELWDVRERRELRIILRFVIWIFRGIEMFLISLQKFVEGIGLEKDWELGFGYV